MITEREPDRCPICGKFGYLEYRTSRTEWHTVGEGRESFSYPDHYDVFVYSCYCTGKKYTWEVIGEHYL